MRRLLTIGLLTSLTGLLLSVPADAGGTKLIFRSTVTNTYACDATSTVDGNILTIKGKISVKDGNVILKLSEKNAGNRTDPVRLIQINGTPSDCTTDDTTITSVDGKGKLKPPYSEPIKPGTQFFFVIIVVNGGCTGGGGACFQSTVAQAP